MNRCANSAVHFDQSIECCDGFRIAQHDGDLSSLRPQRSLALSASLRLHHGLSDNGRRNAERCGKTLYGMHLGRDLRRRAALGRKEPGQFGAVAGQQAGLHFTHAGSGVIAFAFGDFHGFLRSWPIQRWRDSTPSLVTCQHLKRAAA